MNECPGTGLPIDIYDSGVVHCPYCKRRTQYKVKHVDGNGIVYCIESHLPAEKLCLGSGLPAKTKERYFYCAVCDQTATIWTSDSTVLDHLDDRGPTLAMSEWICNAE